MILVHMLICDVVWVQTLMWVKNACSIGKGMSFSAESKYKKGVEESLGTRIWVKVQIKYKQDKKERNVKREIKYFECKM